MNPRHEAFCQHFVFGRAAGNATAAYRAAGYHARKEAAHAAASRLLRRPDIRARIRELEAAIPDGMTHTRRRA